MREQASGGSLLAVPGKTLRAMAFFSGTGFRAPLTCTEDFEVCFSVLCSRRSRLVLLTCGL